MSLRRAAAESTVVRMARRVRERIASRLSPVTRRLAAIDQALVRVVRGSWLHGWLTAEPDPDPIVIDLRETYTVGPVLTLLDRLVPLVANSWVIAAASAATDRFLAAPARAVGTVLCLAFSASLLATVVSGGLTLPVYVFHALGLVVGLLAFRERRDFEALAEAPVWRALLAVFAPPPAPDEHPDARED